MKICFVGQITDSLQNRLAGGAERQMQLLAKYMAKRNHDVVFVITGKYAPNNNGSGIKMISAWNPDRGLSGLRWITYRLPNLRNLLVKIKADVYYLRGYSLFAPTVVSIANKLKVPSIINLASDTDLLIERQIYLSRSDNFFGRISNSIFASCYFYIYGLKKSSWVISQTQKQFNMCKKLNLRSVIIPNIYERHDIKINGTAKNAILWVGAISSFKGIQELADLTSIISDLDFEIVGPIVDESFTPILQEMCLKSNVKWLGELNHEQVMDAISKAKLVINTSPLEGFSNVMIEAWSLGKPVVSLHANPNSLLTGKNKLGDCADGNMHKMVQHIRFWLNNSNERLALEQRARLYVHNNHDPEVICARIEKLINKKTYLK